MVLWFPVELFVCFECVFGGFGFGFEVTFVIVSGVYVLGVLRAVFCVV